MGQDWKEKLETLFGIVVAVIFFGWGAIDVYYGVPPDCTYEVQCD